MLISFLMSNMISKIGKFSQSFIHKDKYLNSAIEGLVEIILESTNGKVT